MSEPAKRSRREYLLSCALAAAAAVTSLMIAVPDVEGMGRGSSMIIGVAALAVLGGVFYLAWTGGGDEPAGSSGRGRKMSLVWLILAIALGVGMARRPVFEMLLEGREATAISDRLSVIAGAIFVLLAAWRIVALLRSK